MTKKDYELIAQALYRAKVSIVDQEGELTNSWFECQYQLSVALAADSENFNSFKFLAFCREGLPK